MSLGGILRGGMRGHGLGMQNLVSTNARSANKMRIFSHSDLGNRYKTALETHKEARSIRMAHDNAHKAFEDAHATLQQKEATHMTANKALLDELQKTGAIKDKAQRIAARKDIRNRIRNTSEWQEYDAARKNVHLARSGIREQEDALYQNFKDTYGKAPGMIKDYMMASDFKGRDGRGMALAQRWGVVGAGWMGLNMAGRAVTGGSLAYNNTGERDIAGIPFI